MDSTNRGSAWPGPALQKPWKITQCRKSLGYRNVYSGRRSNVQFCEILVKPLELEFRIREELAQKLVQPSSKGVTERQALSEQFPIAILRDAQHSTKAISRLCDTINSLWAELHDYVLPGFADFRKRWDAKRKSERLAILREVSADLDIQNDGCIESILHATGAAKAATHLDPLAPFLYPDLSHKTLAHQETLSKLAWWRSHRTPEHFIWNDCEQMNTAAPSELEDPDGVNTLFRVAFSTTQDGIFAEVIPWSTGRGDGKARDRSALVSIAIAALYRQARILHMILGCAKRLLKDYAKKRRESGGDSGVAPDLYHDMSLLPSWGEPTSCGPANWLDLASMIEHTECREREATQFCVSMREDTNTFIRTFRQWANAFPDVTEAITKMVKHIYGAAHTWQYVASLIRSMQRHQDEMWLAAKDDSVELSRAASESLCHLDIALASLSGVFLDVLRCFLQASAACPQKKGQKGEKGQKTHESVILHRLLQAIQDFDYDSPDTGPHFFFVIEALEIAIKDAPSNHIVSHSVFQRLFSDAASLSALASRISDLQPWLLRWRYLDHEGSQEIINQSQSRTKRDFWTQYNARDTALYGLLSNQDFDDDLLQSLRSPLPSLETEESFALVRNAEQKLYDFWSAVDEPLVLSDLFQLKLMPSLGELLHQWHEKADDPRTTKGWDGVARRIKRHGIPTAPLEQSHRPLSHQSAIGSTAGGGYYLASSLKPVAKNAKGETDLVDSSAAYNSSCMTTDDLLRHSTDRRKSSLQFDLSKDRKALDTLIALFDKDSVPSVRSLHWKDLQKAFAALGFSVISEWGSAWNFSHPQSTVRDITIHEPHPEHKFDAWELCELRRRLKRTYECSIEAPFIFLATKGA